MNWDALTTREWASVIWLTIIGVAGVATPSVRNALAPSLKMFLRLWSLHLAVLALLAWVALVCYGAAQLGAWNEGLLKDTIAWVLFYGFASIFAALSAAKQDKFFRRAARAALSVAAVMEFILNLYSFHLAVELVLQPVVTSLLLLEGVAGLEAKTRPVQRLVNGLLTIIGLWIVVATVRGLWASWRGVDPEGAGLAFAFSIWFPLAVLPFVYAFSLVLTYGATFARGSFHNDDGEKPSYMVKAAVLVGLHGNLRAINDLPQHYREYRAIVRAPTFHEALAYVHEYEAAREGQQLEKEARAARLIEYAGVKGVDAEGRLLDQREVKETKEALRWIETCHLGHYNNRGMYRKDLMSRVLADDFTRQGLSEQHGITMRVRKDGQAWYAWRRTSGGQVLGIGMSNGRDHEWLYEGAEPPHGYPGADPSWGDRPYETPPNWS